MPMTLEAKSTMQSPLQQTLTQWAKQMVDVYPPIELPQRRQGYEQFAAMGLPTRRQEAWKYTQLNRLTQHTVVQGTLNTPFKPEALMPYLYPESEGARLVLVNGLYAPELSNLDKMGGVILEPMAVIPDWVETQQENLSKTNPFVGLTAAFYPNVLLLTIPKEEVIETPIQIVLLSTPSPEGLAAHFPCIVIEAHAFSQANVIVSSIGETPQSAYWTNSLLAYQVADTAQLTVSMAQLDSPQAIHFSSSLAVLEPNSQFQLATVALSGDLARHQVQVNHQGAQAQSRLLGLTVLDNTSHVHHHTVIDHTVSHAQSEQTYKAILNDTAHGEFDGSIWIHPQAQQINAAQLNKNLLLSPTARAYTRPQLKIDADDVKCSHGATVGQLSETELFYLQSRGIPFDHARSILTKAFAQDIVEKLPCQSFQEHLMQLIVSRLTSSPSTMKS